MRTGSRLRSCRSTRRACSRCTIARGPSTSRGAATMRWPRPSRGILIDMRAFARAAHAGSGGGVRRVVARGEGPGFQGRDGERLSRRWATPTPSCTTTTRCYRPFWATIADLNVPFYLHPRDPLPSRVPRYDGHPWLRGASWAFGVETATHALRLMASGIFDTHPGLTAILGHLGEMLPVLHLALRSPRHQASARDSRAPDVHRVPARELLRDDQRQLPHADACPGRHRARRRSRAVLGGLPVRGSRRCGRRGSTTRKFQRRMRLKIGRTNAQRLFSLDDASRLRPRTPLKLLRWLKDGSPGVADPASQALPSA